MDQANLALWLHSLQPHTAAGDLADFALPNGIMPLCEDRDLLRQVLVTMPLWDTVGPVGAVPRGPLSMLETDEAQEARASPTSAAGGSRGTRDRPTPGPEDRAAGKRPCLEGTSYPTVMAETSLAAAAYSGRSRHRLRRADGSLVGDPPAHHAEPGTSSRHRRGGHLAQA